MPFDMNQFCSTDIREHQMSVTKEMFFPLFGELSDEAWESLRVELYSGPTSVTECFQDIRKQVDSGQEK